MRRIINSTYVSLDGLIGLLERWHFEYLNEASQKVESEQLAACDALLMGRRTYEAFAAAWPPRTGAIADKVNGMRKYVASTTMGKADWTNSTIIGGDLVEEVTRIKQEPGQDILMYGFGPVAHTLLRHGLLDEVRLWVHPSSSAPASPATCCSVRAAPRRRTSSAPGRSILASSSSPTDRRRVTHDADVPAVARPTSDAQALMSHRSGVDPSRWEGTPPSGSRGISTVTGHVRHHPVRVLDVGNTG